MNGVELNTGLSLFLYLTPDDGFVIEPKYCVFALVYFIGLNI